MKAATAERFAVQLQAPRRVGASILYDVPAAGLSAATLQQRVRRPTDGEPGHRRETIRSVGVVRVTDVRRVQPMNQRTIDACDFALFKIDPQRRISFAPCPQAVLSL
jgi:hypothetical protein